MSWAEELTRDTGETDLFIAAEFIEERYTGAPHLGLCHLLDRFRDPIDAKKGRYSPVRS